MIFRRSGGSGGAPGNIPPDGGDEITRRIERPRAEPAGSSDDEKTVFVPRPARPAPAAAAPTSGADEEPATRLYRPPASTRDPAAAPAAAASPGHGASAGPEPAAESDWDPVAGWLVVVDGPGKGQSLAIGFGMNQIGRDAGQKIRLAFGDDQVARTGHSAVTYDPVTRKFFLTHGGGRNLTYLAGAPVLSPVELHGGEEITIGRTRLRFVPFCGPNFNWQD